LRQTQDCNYLFQEEEEEEEEEGEETITGG